MLFFLLFYTLADEPFFILGQVLFFKTFVVDISYQGTNNPQHNFNYVVSNFRFIFF